MQKPPTVQTASGAIEPTGPTATDGPKHRNGSENYYTGAEPFFSFFTQSQVILGSLRLTIESRVVVPTGDLSSQIEGARRGFQHSGDLRAALQDVARIASVFKHRAQTWEREYQSRSSDKRTMSGTLIHRLKAEASLVRGNITSIERALTKLEVTLHQMVGEAAASSERDPSIQSIGVDAPSDD